MRRALKIVAAVLTWAWLPAQPAWAWGSYTHVWIAERAYGMLVARHPWLAAHRDAFLWGSIAGDIDAAPDSSRPPHARTHSDSAVSALWSEARSCGDRGAQAFVLGWAVHVGSDVMRDQAFSEEGFEAALKRAGAQRLPNRLEPLMDWAVDAAMVPKSGGTLFNLYRSTVMNAGTPAGAPLCSMLGRVFSTDEGTYMAWARLQAAMSAGTVDRYLAERARFVRVEPWVEPLRSPEVRNALGNLNPLMARAVEQGVRQAQDLLESAPPSP